MKTQRETPDFVCDKILKRAGITNGMRVLEPSVGEGKILKRLFDTYNMSNLEIVASELNKERIQKAKEILTEDVLNHHNNSGNRIIFFQEDFMINRPHVDTQLKYDRVIACPPFKNNIDLEHIKLMYDLTKSFGGKIVSLTSPYWLTNNEPIQVEFRKWLEGKDHTLEILPDNSFVEKDKTVPTAILSIFK